MLKCIHIADVHFRGLSRHDEYRHAFIDMFKSIRKEKPRKTSKRNRKKGAKAEKIETERVGASKATD